MSKTAWFSLGLLGCVVVACGGSVSLGEVGQGVNGTSGGTSGTSGTSGSSGTSGTTADCSAPNACGPAPGMPAMICPDGSTGGNTGKCVAQKDGSCGWEIRECPPAPPGGCWDKDGNFDVSFKKCTTDADCVAVDYQVDCCGSMHSAGVNKTSEADAKACAAKRGSGMAQCDCLAKPTVGDDGTSDPSGTAATKALFCNATGTCETSYKGTACGKDVCGPSQTCCSGVPFPEPTCINGNMCPISQRKHKKDIAYLSEADKQRLSDELLGIPLATYRYKSESAEDRAHLGFIIDDIAPSPAVTPNAERVDMYGYATMSVATLQVQAREIAELRKQVEELKSEIAKSRAKK